MFIGRGNSLLLGVCNSLRLNNSLNNKFGGGVEWNGVGWGGVGFRGGGGLH
jgi:hypothetical protein